MAFTSLRLEYTVTDSAVPEITKNRVNTLIGGYTDHIGKAKSMDNIACVSLEGGVGGLFLAGLLEASAQNKFGRVASRGVAFTSVAVAVPCAVYHHLMGVLHRRTASAFKAGIDEFVSSLPGTKITSTSSPY